MKKYLLSGLTGVAALLLVVTPVMASSGHYQFGHRSSGPSLEIRNDADISTNMNVSSNTGSNDQDARGSASGSTSRVRSLNTILTGSASADGVLTNEANNGNYCDCLTGRRGDVEIRNDADINTTMVVASNTGRNEQDASGRASSSSSRSHHHYQSSGGSAGVVSDNYAETGGARAVGDVWNVVNSQYSLTQ